MIIEQLYTKCLSQGAYLIESEGEIAVIDPLREVNQYLDMAAKYQGKIKYIFETHFHADFVSGHLTLSELTGAPIIYGPNATPSFKCYIARDNEEFKVGKLKIKVIHTPGHTMESTTYLLLDEEGNQHAIFTGDTLFLGDVGRPDLAQKSSNTTMQDLASILFDSLRNRIMTLPDDILIYPGHGAGSACGKNMSDETVGRLGEQKKLNYALNKKLTRTEFISQVTEGLKTPPAYFPMNVKLNKEGYLPVDEVLSKSKKKWSVQELEKVLENENVTILDVRHQSDFAKGHIPSSIFIGIDGGFAPWVGAVLKDVNQKIILVTKENRLNEVITRLSRVGFDNVLGYLDGGIKAWGSSGKPVGTVQTIDPIDFAKEYKTKDLKVLDVRNQNEFKKGHLSNVNCIPLSELENRINEISETNFYVHCAGGYRSMIANSILLKHHLSPIDVLGGYSAIKNHI